MSLEYEMVPCFLYNGFLMETIRNDVTITSRENYQ